MEEGAKQNLDSIGILIISGAGGNVDKVVKQYLEEIIKVSEGGCHNDHNNDTYHCSCHEN